MSNFLPELAHAAITRVQVVIIKFRNIFFIFYLMFKSQTSISNSLISIHLIGLSKIKISQEMRRNLGMPLGLRLD